MSDMRTPPSEIADIPSWRNIVVIGLLYLSCELHIKDSKGRDSLLLRLHDYPTIGSVCAVDLSILGLFVGNIECLAC